MTQPQISRAARQKKQLRAAAQRGHSEDPLLRRMLNTHIHCGQMMQPVIVEPALLNDGPGGTILRGLVTYRCACGFSFDQRQY
jgi:hypothetical protein